MESTPQEIRELVAKSYFEWIGKGCHSGDWPGWNAYDIYKLLDERDADIIQDDMDEAGITEIEDGDLCDLEGNIQDYKEVAMYYVMNNPEIIFKNWLRGDE